MGKKKNRKQRTKERSAPVRTSSGPQVVTPEPVAAKPVAAEPVAAEPVAAEPVAAEPVAAEPVAAEPVAAEVAAEATSPSQAPVNDAERSGAPIAIEEHRASPRVSIAVDIHLTSDSHFFSGLSGDISEGGLFLSTYRALPVGSEVDLEFSLPGTAQAIHARGAVKWVREHSAHQPRGLGIAFDALSGDDRDRIHDFCAARPPLYYEDVG